MPKLQDAKHLAVVTLVFPGSLSDDSPRIAPQANAVNMPDNTSAQSIPSTSNPFSPFSQDKTLAFSMPFEEAATFLYGVRELPEEEQANVNKGDGPRTWVAKPLRKPSGSRNKLRSWILDSWTKFVDLLKVRTLCLWKALGWEVAYST